MRILAFGAHPDDIEVGMGGTIARMVSEGHEVTMVVTTVPNLYDERRQEAKDAAKILGANLLVLDIPPLQIVADRGLVHRMDEAYKAIRPSEVYTHWLGDSHQDHVAVAQATLAVTRRNQCSVYMYEQTIPGGITPSSFRAQRYVALSDYDYGQKERAIRCHKTQLSRNGGRWLYGIKGRAQYHGYQIGQVYAEAFEIIKQIV